MIACGMVIIKFQILLGYMQMKCANEVGSFVFGHWDFPKGDPSQETPVVGENACFSSRAFLITVLFSFLSLSGHLPMNSS